jgi:hypothetical protein
MITTVSPSQRQRDAQCDQTFGTKKSPTTVKKLPKLRATKKILPNKFDGKQCDYFDG